MRARPPVIPPERDAHCTRQYRRTRRRDMPAQRGNRAHVTETRRAAVEAGRSGRGLKMATVSLNPKRPRTRFIFSSSTCCTAPGHASHSYSTLPSSMSVRSFTVFRDTTSDLPQSHNVSDVRPLTPPATDPAATLLSTLAAIEKENLHPVTGQRTGPTVSSEAKKRKSGALATKVLVAPSSKKHRELKGEQKKTRKPLSSTRSSDARKSSTKSSRSSRKASPLPPVAEEKESQHRPARLSISQLDIDSRCYELTVSPLADVSEAYDATRTGSQEPDVHTERVRTAIAPLSSGTDSTSRKSRRNQLSVIISLLPWLTSLSNLRMMHHIAPITRPARPTTSQRQNASASIPPLHFLHRRQPRNASNKPNHRQHLVILRLLTQSDESKVIHSSFQCDNQFPREK